MLAPLTAAGVAAAAEPRAAPASVARALSVKGDLSRADDIARLRAGRRSGGDSLHLVVMDAHRELNALQARIATSRSTARARTTWQPRRSRRWSGRSCAASTPPSG